MNDKSINIKDLQEMEKLSRNSTIQKLKNEFLEVKKSTIIFSKALKSLEEQARNLRIQVINTIDSRLDEVLLLITEELEQQAILEEAENLKKEAIKSSRDRDFCTQCDDSLYNEGKVKFRTFLNVLYMANWISIGPLCLNCIDEIETKSMGSSPQEIYKIITGEEPKEEEKPNIKKKVGSDYESRELQ